MVRVHQATTDLATAWRIRDELACHPLLGGAAAHIEVRAGFEKVELDGWTDDETLTRVAIRLTVRAAGRRAVRAQLSPRAGLAH
jgi:hypothetical protein